MSTELHAAAQAGRLSDVVVLLHGETDVNARDADGATALHLAAANGHQGVVDALVESGAEVNAKDALGWTALMKAIFNFEQNRGFPEIVGALIDAGAEIETRIAYGTRPLMLAAGYGEAGVVDVLLAAGADVMAQNEGGRTARVMAESKDYVEVINQLFEAEMNLRGESGVSCSTTHSDNGSTTVINFVRKPG